VKLSGSTAPPSDKKMYRKLALRNLDPEFPRFLIVVRSCSFDFLVKSKNIPDPERVSPISYHTAELYVFSLILFFDIFDGWSIVKLTGLCGWS